MKKTNVKVLSLLAMSVAGAMILSYIESFIYLGIPGVKLGLPNIFIIFILYRIGVPQAASVSLVRCLLTALTFGSVLSLWYSLAGAILSLILMTVMKKTSFFSNVGVSVVGAISHNAAQIAVAVAVTGVSEIVSYLPFLCISGVIAGIFIGVAAGIMIQRIPERFTDRKNYK